MAKESSKDSIKSLTKKKKKYNMQDHVALLEEQKLKLPKLNPDDIKTFSDLPISKNTLKGLTKSGYLEPTKIQKKCLPHALLGIDFIGESKTGSGKTLAFVIPMLETLYSKFWKKDYGIGCVIVTPTRELAQQIFEVTRRVGQYHNFSAGLIIGGKDWRVEQKRAGNCNILICTPGRLVQHMTENPYFSLDNVQMFILDEADACLSVENRQTFDTIFQDLPSERHTMIFSATQTRKVEDLVRAGCKNPIFCSVHEFSKTATPKKLKEQYLLCEHEDKMNILWYFLKENLNKKILIFVSTGKQVQFIGQIFKGLKYKGEIYQLYGRLPQLRRMKAYDDFCRDPSCVMICTDACSRGLDFPSLHWVVQVDCPENATSYIHRVGRTARHDLNGESVLFLTPDQERPFLKELAQNKISMEKFEIEKQSSVHNIDMQMQKVLIHKPVLHELAIATFRTYLKSCLLMRPELRSVKSMDMEAYARSLGLQAIPNCSEVLHALRLKKQKGEDVVQKRAKPTKEPQMVLPKLPKSNIRKGDVVPVSREATVSKHLRDGVTGNKHVFFDDSEEDKDEGKEELKQTKEETNFAERNDEALSFFDSRLAALPTDPNESKNKKKSKTSKKEQKEDEATTYDFYESGDQSGSDEDGEDEDIDLDHQKYIDELPDPDLLYNNKEDSDVSEEESQFKEKKRKLSVDSEDTNSKKRRKNGCKTDSMTGSKSKVDKYKRNKKAKVSLQEELPISKNKKKKKKPTEPQID